MLKAFLLNSSVSDKDKLLYLAYLADCPFRDIGKRYNRSHEWARKKALELEAVWQVKQYIEEQKEKQADIIEDKLAIILCSAYEDDFFI
jgi:hypothetical protein